MEIDETQINLIVFFEKMLKLEDIRKTNSR